ncbi:hypothetical protein D3C75_1147280 [compost metagenome]
MKGSVTGCRCAVARAQRCAVVDVDCLSARERQVVNNTRIGGIAIQGQGAPAGANIGAFYQVVRGKTSQ